jgi:hypothetical protein
MGMIPRGSPTFRPVDRDLSTMTLRQANPGDPHRVSGHQSIIRRMRGEELSELTGGGRAAWSVLVLAEGWRLDV